MKRGFLAIVLSAVLAAAASAQTAATPQTSAADRQSESVADRALYAVGNMGSTQLYYTYMILGLLGDSYAKGVYDKKTSLSLLGEIIHLTKLSQQALENLKGKGDLTAEDESLIDHMHGALDTLLKQADGLSEYVNGKDDGTKFQSYRKEAWTKISAILGIEGVKTSP